MSIIQSCGDTKDCVDLFRPQGLYLKPIARINVSVQLPQLRKSGSKISNWEVMEKVKEMARPFTFPVFKVSKSSLEFIRFEAEIENYSSMENVLAKLDMRTIKLSGFTELLKIRAAESKNAFPTRADWDEFFLDNKDMNEMKSGERPDTIHLSNLPVKWFLQVKSGEVPDKPSEFVLKKAFASFGDIRMVDIPLLDPYRQKMTSDLSGIRTFSFGEDLIFQAYVQFKEYIGFVKCMNALKGMKLCYKDRDTSKAWTSNIKVDFDQTKHLSETTVKKRKEERERLVKEEVEKLETDKKKARLAELKKNQQLRLLEEEEREQDENKAAKKLVAEQRRLAREERRKNIRLKKMGLTEEEEMSYRIGAEERKLVLAQRKLESIRVLDELISRAKGVGKIKLGLKAKLDVKKENDRGVDDSDDEELKTKEKEIRDKLVMKLKKQPEKNSHAKKLKKSKTEGFSSDSDSDSSRGKIRLEKITDDELSDIKSSEDESEIGSDEELRLTSTDDSDTDNKNRHKKKDKKEKRVKKEKEKVKVKAKEKEKEKKSSRRGRDEKSSRSDEARKRELDREIKKAERIAKAEKRRSPDRDERRADLWEHEKYDRDRSGRSEGRNERGERERTPTGYYGMKDYLDRRRRSNSRDDDLMDDRERDNEERKKFVGAANMKRVNLFLRQQGMRKNDVEREMERAYEQYFSSLAKKEPGGRGLPAAMPMGKSSDLSKEEEWERMMNPHLFEDSNSRRGYRKPLAGQHYEDTQKEHLQAEIRIRERRERDGTGGSGYERAPARSRSRDRRRRSRSRDRRRRERY